MMFPFSKHIFTGAVLGWLLLANVASATNKVYVVLWFDTEDYVDPISDDAALRIAKDLDAVGVRATFKVVGEKARVLEQRQRWDVIEALSKHSVGYHSNWHSQQPAPAVYEQRMGMEDGAAEFERREQPGIVDIRRIFGIAPSCYGQPGNSWAPQSNAALRHMGIPVYLDAGDQVGLNDQPFWYGGLLYVYQMGPYQIRAALDGEESIETTFGKFDEAVKKLASAGGGLISTYYHPTEFLHTQFWDAANFAEGRTAERKNWVLPKRRTEAEAERCFRTLQAYVAHAQKTPGVTFIAADDLLRLYANPIAPVVDKKQLAEHFERTINFLSTPAGDLSAADILLQLLDLPAQYVDGPDRAGVTNVSGTTIPNYLFDAAVRDTRSFIQANRRLPNEVFVGAERLALGDFAATLARRTLRPGPIEVVTGKLDFQNHVSKNAAESFRWPIHPKDFAPVELLDLARLEAWTLKPARLR